MRTALTVSSLAVSLFVFTMLMAALSAMQSVAEASAAQLRLVVHHKTTMTKLLPLGERTTLASMPGVASVCGMRWFGGRLDRSQEQFPSMACERESFPQVFDDFYLSPEEFDAWRRQRTAAIVGAGLAERAGWSKGSRVVLKSTIPPYLQLEFNIVGITRAVGYSNMFILPLDYLLESLRANPIMTDEYNNSVNIYWVRVQSPEQLSAVRAAIDERFANSPDPTMSELEQSFVAQFTKMFGDIPRIIRNIGIIVMASILLVICNTVSSSVRERVSELAVLKAVGYSSSQLITMLLTESILLGMLGAIGCVAALLAFGISEASGLSMPYFPIVSVSFAITVIGASMGIFVSCLAVVPSAFRVARVSVTTALRETG
jgi:putative ABC transport system permease protein